MIDKKDAVPQVARMAQLLGYPKNEREALNELVLAAMVAKDVETCRRVIGDFIENAGAETRCPLPSAIRAAIHAAESTDRYWEVPPSPVYLCDACTDTGMAGGKGAADPWRWCSCKAATQKRRKDPGAVTEANLVLSKIIERGLKVPA